MWQKLQLALHVLRVITAPKAVDSLLVIMSMHGSGKLKLVVCKIYPTINLVCCLPRTDMIALNEFFPAQDPKGDHSSFPFRWPTTTAQ